MYNLSSLRLSLPGPGNIANKRNNKTTSRTNTTNSTRVNNSARKRQRLKQIAIAQGQTNYALVQLHVPPHKQPRIPRWDDDLSVKQFHRAMRYYKIKIHNLADGIRRKLGLPPDQTSAFHFPNLARLSLSNASKGKRPSKK
jgi:hypothetical protein